MTDLTTFLAARLDEDEQAARDAHYEGQRWISEEEGVWRWPDDEAVHTADRKRDAAHIARHDPARVLADVEAKRAILDEHKRQEPVRPLIGPQCCRCVKEMHGWQEDWSAQEYPCRTLRLLASVYVDHSGYDPSWAIE